MNAFPSTAHSYAAGTTGSASSTEVSLSQPPVSQPEARLRILYITTTYPTPFRPHQGTFNHAMVGEMRKVHAVQVIAPVPWTHRLTFVQQNPTARDTFHPTFIYPPKCWRSQYGYWYRWSIGRAIRQVANSFRPDAVLSYWVHPDGEASLAVARRLKVPLIMMVGGSDVRLLVESPIRRRRISKVLQAASRVIVVSADLRERVRSLGVSIDKIELIYRGVDAAVFAPGPRSAARQRLAVPHDAVLLVWAGRMVDVKNPSLLVRALPQIKQSLGCRLSVVFVGDGPLLTETQELAKALHVADLCRFLGNRPHEELADWFRGADATVLTSDSEGVPNVLLESAACGTPFIATDVGGVAEIADSEIDRLVPPGDVEALGTAVAAVLERRLDAGTEAPVAQRLRPDTLKQSVGRVGDVIRRAIGETQHGAR